MHQINWWDVPFSDLEITVSDIAGSTITDVVPATKQ
jgi:hypothetical protein